MNLIFKFRVNILVELEEEEGLQEKWIDRFIPIAQIMFQCCSIKINM